MPCMKIKFKLRKLSVGKTLVSNYTSHSSEYSIHGRTRHGGSVTTALQKILSAVAIPRLHLSLLLLSCNAGDGARALRVQAQHSTRGSPSACFFETDLTKLQWQKVFLACFSVFQTRFLYRPDWPGTHCVDQADNKLRGLLASASRVLGLKVPTTTTGLWLCFW